jgi:hypothetical protein
MDKIALSQVILTHLFHVLLLRKPRSVISMPHILDQMESEDIIIMRVEGKFGQMKTLKITKTRNTKNL